MRKMFCGIAALLCCTFILLLNHVSALDNGLARTPPMGWMSWERYRCIIDCEKYPDECISEKLFQKAADRLAEDGYREAGYEYVIIDDCWMEKERDEAGRLVADRERFPNGIKALADYIHGKGLKFGIYEDYGTHTCAGYPGVIDHMPLDAQTFADWDVDYVKLDGCYANVTDMDYGYPEFGRLLNKTGRPMVYSCSWPVYQEEKGITPNYEALKKHCNLWRNWDDIDDSWQSVEYITNYFAGNQSRIQPHAGPGHWNDPDMLIIGNYGLSLEQSKSQMAIWAVLAAPLIMSNNLHDIRPEFRDILLNRDIIAVNQDSLGIQGLRVKKERSIETWVRKITPIVDGVHSYAIAFASKRYDGSPYAIAYSPAEFGLSNARGYHVVDLFNKARVFERVEANQNLTIRINPSGCEFLKFIPVAVGE